MSTSTNLGLTLTGTGSSDVSQTFENWRLAINGESNSSNMNIIDSAVGELQEDVLDLAEDVGDNAEDIADLKSQINEFSGNIADTAAVVSGFYIGTNGKIGMLSPGESERTIWISGKPNTKYTVKKSTSTIMRVGVYSSSTVENLTQLVNYSGHASASADPLYVNTDSTNTYIFIQLFATSDSASLKSIDANLPSLVVTDLDISQISSDLYKYINNRYILYPTGDTTNRRVEVESALAAHKEVYFTSGDYYFNATVTLPSNTKICGAGKTSRLIMSDNATGQFIQCGNDCQISSLWIDGGLTSKPSGASTNRHGIRVQNNAQTLQMHDCWVTGFGGSGIRVDNTGYANLSSVQVENCYFQYNGYGIYFLSKGEYGVVNNCSFIDNYVGAFVNGGNNIISGCTLERNDIGASVNGSGGENTGHGAFVGCSFNHNTNIGLEILNTDNGYLVSGCQFFRNDNYELSIGVAGVNIVGGQFGVSTSLRFSGAAFVSFDGCEFAGSPTVSYAGTATTRSANCYKFDGTPIDILRPGSRSYTNFAPGPMLTIIDDDGHKKFYEDLLPIIQAKKVPITTAIYNYAIGVSANAMTWAQVEECYEAGAEIVSHSYNHLDSETVTSMAENEIQYDYQMSRNGLSERGILGAKYFVYVGATHSITKVVNAAQNVFACGINSSGNVMNYMDTLDPYNLRRYRIESDYSYNLDSMKGLIDDCLSSGGWMIWMIHTSSAGWDADAKSAISDSIDYALAQGLPIVTVDAGCRKMGII